MTTREKTSSRPAKQTHGTAILTCSKHPTYRWTQTKFTTPGATRNYMGRGVLMFDGEEGGLPGSPFNLTERSLASYSPDYQAHFRSSYTPECNCSIDKLRFLAWAD